MNRLKWRISTGPGDFLPLVIGFVMLFISLPTVLLLLFNADQRSGPIGGPLVVIMAVGVMLGAGFLVRGIQLCSSPGSWTYRIAHGRFFSH